MKDTGSIFQDCLKWGILSIKSNSDITTNYLKIILKPLVPKGGFEPHKDYSPLDPESSASTNSATSAC